MNENTIKRPYYSEEEKGWYVERFQATEGMIGKHTTWCATEAEAEWSFNFWLERGYKIVEDVPSPASITIEPDTQESEAFGVEPAKQTEDVQEIARREIAQTLDRLSLGAQRIIFDNYRYPYGHDIREVGERAKYIQELVLAGIVEVSPSKIVLKKDVRDLLAKIL